MKPVVLFIPHLGVGGAELQLCLLALRLRDAGWEPTVATIEDLHGVAPRLAAAGVEVAVLPRAGRSGWDTIAGLARLVRQRKAAVVHAWLFASNWRAALARVLVPDVRVVASIRGMEDDLGPLALIAYRAVAPMIDAIIVNSRAVLERSAERTGIPRATYRLVRNGVDLDRLDREASRPAALPWDPEISPVVGYVGTLHPRKRAVSLASVAAAVLRRVPNARFLVIGDGPDRKELEAACARLGVADRFRLAGYAEAVGPLLRRVDVLVHPSMNEGSSNAILEAMAAGVPVVAYAVSGNLETVVDGQTGALVPDGQEDALAGAVATLLENPAEARRLGSGGRDVIERDFSVAAMVRTTAGVYDEVTSNT